MITGSASISKIRLFRTLQERTRVDLPVQESQALQVTREGQDSEIKDQAVRVLKATVSAAQAEDAHLQVVKDQFPVNWTDKATSQIRTRSWSKRRVVQTLVDKMYLLMARPFPSQRLLRIRTVMLRNQFQMF